jgi:hypothetical protein
VEDDEQTVVSGAPGAVEVWDLADGSCEEAGKCKYEVILLDQVMFGAIASGAGTTMISAVGNAEMELGTLGIGIRRSLEIAPLKKERSLEEVVGNISGAFEVNAANGVGSSAATRLGGGMLITILVVVAAAAFNLMQGRCEGLMSNLCRINKK